MKRAFNRMQWRAVWIIILLYAHVNVNITAILTVINCSVVTNKQIGGSKAEHEAKLFAKKKEKKKGYLHIAYKMRL